MTRLMPDFTDALDDHLRLAAMTAPVQQDAAPPRQRRVFGRLAPLAVGCTAIAAALLAVSGARDDGTTPAYGRPAVLRTPIAANAEEVLRSFNAGVVVRSLPGDSGRMTEVREVSAFGGTAYFATGPNAWCLTVPDSTIAQPADPLRTGSKTCQLTETVYTYGIALADGRNIIAAIPENATPPTLTAPDGATQTLQPSKQGIVTANAEPGSLLELYAADGSARPLRVGGR